MLLVGDGFADCSVCGGGGFRGGQNARGARCVYLGQPPLHRGADCLSAPREIPHARSRYADRDKSEGPCDGQVFDGQRSEGQFPFRQHLGFRGLLFGLEQKFIGLLVC